jgi:hypothetical protein
VVVMHKGLSASWMSEGGVDEEDELAEEGEGDEREEEAGSPVRSTAAARKSSSSSLSRRLNSSLSSLDSENIVVEKDGVSAENYGVNEVINVKDSTDKSESGWREEAVGVRRSRAADRNSEIGGL